jgi:hypothetical protein
VEVLEEGRLLDGAAVVREKEERRRKGKERGRGVGNGSWVADFIAHFIPRWHLPFSFSAVSSLSVLLFFVSRDDDLTEERTVIVNGKVHYRGHPDSGFWKLSMVLGRGKSSAFEVLVEAVPRSALQPQACNSHLYAGPYEYTLWIDGFPFPEAQNNWMSELGATQQIILQKQELEELSREAQGLSVSHSSSSSSEATFTQRVKAAHYRDLQYIREHWHRKTTCSKSHLGYPKNEVTWAFTLAGRPHQLTLTHSEKSGKRRIVVDGRQIFVHKPNIINGLLLQKHGVHRLEIEGVKLEVRLTKLDHSQAKRGSSASSSSSSSPSHRPNFSYDLLVEGVPFYKCTKTLPEYAGGMVDVESKLQQQQREAARKAKVEAAKQKDPRMMPSPDPEE